MTIDELNKILLSLEYSKFWVNFNRDIEIYRKWVAGLTYPVLATQYQLKQEKVKQIIFKIIKEILVQKSHLTKDQMGYRLKLYMKRARLFVSDADKILR